MDSTSDIAIPQPAMTLIELLDLIQGWHQADRILQAIIPALKREFAANLVEIYWLDETTHEIVDIGSLANDSGNPWLKCQVRFLVGQGLSGIIAERDLPLRTGDPGKAPGSISPAGRFKHFLGVPMHLDGRVAGVLSLARDIDRAFTPDEQAQLQYFADRLCPQLQICKQIATLIEPAYEAETQSVASGDFQWYAMVRNGRIVHRMYSPGVAALTGYSRLELVADPDTWLDLIVPEDREHVQRGYQRLLLGDSLRQEYRIRKRDGSIRHLSEMGHGYYYHGILLELSGFVSDISAQKETEAERDMLLAMLSRNLARWQTVETIVASLDSLDLDQTLLTIHNALMEQAGFDRAGILLVDETDSNYIFGTWGTDAGGGLIDARSCRQPVDYDPSVRALITGEVPYILKHSSDPSLPEPPGMSPATCQNALVPLKSGNKILGIISVDNLISQRPIEPEEIPALQLAAQHVAVAIVKARYYAQEHAARAKAEATERRLAFLAEASRVLASSLDYQTTLQNIAHLAVPHFADWCSVVIGEGTGSYYQLAEAYADPAKAEWVRGNLARYPDTLQQAYAYPHVLETGKPDFLPNIPDEVLVAAARDEDHLRMMREFKMRSYIAVPLVARDRLLGAIAFGTADSGRSYTQEDFTLAEDLAHRAAVAMDNAHLYGQMAEQANELNAIINAMQEGVYVCDTSGKMTRINLRGAELIGMPIAQAIHPIEIYQATNRMRWPDGKLLELDEYPLMRALRGETGNGLRSVIQSADTGAELHILTSYAPIRNNDGDITGAVVVVSDITEIHKMERQKDEFLSVASHELKTPLTSIKGFTQMATRRLVRGGHTAEAEMLATVDQQVNRLTELVNDLLDVSRIQTGKLIIELTPLNLADLVRRACISLQTTTESHQITVEAPAQVLIDGDASRLDQVLTNLIGNAIKYSPEGGPVEVCLRQEGTGAILSVRDYGIGIPPQDHEKLFERFQRASNVNGYHISGFGLGLYISREIIRAHQGQIWIDPDTAPGSMFLVSLPLRDGDAGE